MNPRSPRAPSRPENGVYVAYAQLRPIWSYYWVGQLGPPENARRPAAAAYAVGHGSPVHLFDKTGQIRIVFDADFRPAAMAHDLEALLRE